MASLEKASFLSPRRVHVTFCQPVSRKPEGLGFVTTSTSRLCNYYCTMLHTDASSFQAYVCMRSWTPGDSAGESEGVASWHLLPASWPGNFRHQATANMASDVFSKTLWGSPCHGALPREYLRACMLVYTANLHYFRLHYTTLHYTA